MAKYDKLTQKDFEVKGLLVIVFGNNLGYYYCIGYFICGNWSFTKLQQ